MVRKEPDQPVPLPERARAVSTRWPVDLDAQGTCPEEQAMLVGPEFRRLECRGRSRNRARRRSDGRGPICRYRVVSVARDRRLLERGLAAHWNVRARGSGAATCLRTFDTCRHAGREPRLCRPERQCSQQHGNDTVSNERVHAPGSLHRACHRGRSRIAGGGGVHGTVGLAVTERVTTRQAWLRFPSRTAPGFADPLLRRENRASRGCRTCDRTPQRR